MQNWYVYKILFDDGTFYIGYRGTKNQIQNDFLVKYFSSSKIVKQKILDGHKFFGEIIDIFKNQEDAYLFEQNEIKNNFTDNNILNKACYFGKSGFGILNEQAKLKRSNTIKELWKNPEFREKMINSQRNSFTEDRRNNLS